MTVESAQTFKFEKEIAKKLGQFWSDELRDAKISHEKISLRLLARGFEVDSSTIKRFLDGAESKAHLMQAIARLFEEMGLLQVPEDYKSSSATDYLLDVLSGRVPLGTLKVGQVADADRSKKAVNNARHRSDRFEAEKSLDPVSSKTKSGVYKVGIKDGVKILKEAVEAQGMPLEDVAIKCSMEPERLKTLLAGKDRPDADDMGRLMAIFGGDINPLARAYMKP